MASFTYVFVFIYIVRVPYVQDLRRQEKTEEKTLTLTARRRPRPSHARSSRHPRSAVGASAPPSSSRLSISLCRMMLRWAPRDLCRDGGGRLNEQRSRRAGALRVCNPGEGGDKFRKDHACCTPAAHCLSPFRDSVCLSLCVYPICVVRLET